MRETQPPAVDGRRRTELRADAIDRARSYTPQWVPDTDDVGTALVDLFADITDDVITRLDRTPEKHRISFFHELGFDRAPPQPARLPLVFQIAEGLTRNVPITAGTQAVAPPVGDGVEQLFEIPEGAGFEATPARLDAVYSVSPQHDAIFEHGTALASGEETHLFSGSNEQEHVLYLGHTDFFVLTPDTSFEIRIEGTGVSVFEDLHWQYYGVADVEGEPVEAWHQLFRPHDSSEPSDDASTTAADDATGETVTLRFRLETGDEFVETTLPGVEDAEAEAEAETEPGEPPAVTELESLWVRCVAPATTEDPLFETRVDAVSLSLVSPDEGVTPHMLIANDVPLPTESDEPVHPFGETPFPMNTLYVASDEAFSKTGSTVRLTFEGLSIKKSDSTEVPHSSSNPLDLSWEYWNGAGWTYLEVEDDQFWEPDSGPYYVDFTVESDAEATAVLGHEHYWVRVRLVGDQLVRFGPEKSDSEEVPEVWKPVREAVPEFEQLTLSYPNQAAERQPVDHAVPQNNLSYGVDAARQVSPDTDGETTIPPPAETRPLAPFRRLPDARTVPPATPRQTLYLGFDGPLDDGPIQLLFAAVDKTYEVGFYPRARWEYRVVDSRRPDADEWAPLDVEDGTEGLLRRGMVSLVFPEPTTATERFGRTRHWIRARLVGDDQFDVTVETATPDASPIVISAVDGEEERVVLQNRGATTVDLTDYRLDVGYGKLVKRVRPLPDGPTVRPGESLVVATGEKTVGSFDVSLGYRRYVLNNDDTDTVALFTPDGELVTANRPIKPSTTTPVVRETGDDGLRPCREVAPVVLAADPKPTTRPPSLRGIYPNAGWADNVRTVSDEVLGASDGSADQTLSFENRPAIDETVWVDELSALTEEERDALKRDHPARVDERTGDDGTVTAFWVQWTAVENFVESTAEDRHYVIDRTDGTLTFGDGSRGAIPPIGDDVVRASYRTGGGVDGNVPAGAIAGLVTAVAYVEAVTNPEPGSGGADAELTSKAVRRAARSLRDRNRAVAAADFERLAQTASRELERVRCIPGMDREGASRPGWVTVLLVPRTSVPKPMPSAEVKRRVEERLRQFAPAPLTQATPGQVVVRGPSYIPVDVETTLVVDEGVPSVSTVEEAAISRIAAFLHPLTGGPDGDGWAFGDLPCLSDVYALLERVDGVDHVATLDVTFVGSDESHTITDGDERVPQVTADTLVCSGSHQVYAGGSSIDEVDGTGVPATPTEETA